MLFVFELLVFSLDVLDFVFEVFELVFKRAELALQILHSVDLSAGFMRALGGCVGLVVVGVFFLDAVQLDDHFLPALLFEHESSALQHFFEFGLTVEVSLPPFFRVVALLAA